MAVSLTPLQALCFMVIYCLIYLLPLYALPATRPSPIRSRDAPDSIRARIRAVSASTLICSLTTFFILRHTDLPSSPLRHMGYWPVGLSETANVLLLTALLFSAPIYESLLIDGWWRDWVRLDPLGSLWTHWPTWRNLVAGPITEECLFRAAAVPLLLLAGSETNFVIFVSPLIFGLAHIHHFYEFRLANPQTPLAMAVVRSLVQLTYTSIFGSYATFIFLRTGSILAAISVHILCNTMGLPRLWGSLHPYWITRQSEPKVWYGHVFISTVLYYLLLLGGATLWWANLYSLTQSPMALALL
ncbi:hypothetical protein CDD82_3452 [Ophiocordyceps australis]|uniref:intramembrane prenyl-peptidase Rce1 n=1 Tax=Ophiocordyceps australis TaxID=1399860 RepID=A0A2C5ZCR1_9HYPO|nr:hypothetical protein CDD82_3452 [Ophiocordyceps australis]